MTLMPLKSAFRNLKSAIASLRRGSHVFGPQLPTERRAPGRFEFGDRLRDKLVAVNANAKPVAADATDDAEGSARAGHDPLKTRALRLVEADDDARGRLAEELHRRGQLSAVEFDFSADAPASERREAALGERDGEAAVRAVVRRFEQALLGGAQSRLLHLALASEVEARHARARRDHLLKAAPLDRRRVLARAEVFACLPDERNQVSLALKALRDDAAHVFDEAQHADDGRRVD